MHEEKNTLGGIMVLSKLKTPVTLINDVYEDRELRAERKNLVSSLQLELDRITKGGGILNTSSEKMIIEKAIVGFVNNKSNQHKLSLIIWPIYDPEIYLDNDKMIANRPTIELNLTDWKVTNNQFTALQNESDKIVLHSIVKDVNREKFLNWSKECESKQSLRVFNDMGGNRAVDKVFLKELGTLHLDE